MLSRALTIVLALVAAASPARAQMPSATDLLTQSVPSAHPAVSLEYAFPGLSHPQQILAGEDVALLFTVRNDAAAPVNLTYVTGAVASPTDARFILDRFVATAYRTGIAPGTDHSFEYRFQMNAKLPSRDFVVAVVVFYSDDSGVERFADTLFNQTVAVVEVDHGLLDYEMLGTLALLAVCAAGIAYAIFSAVAEQPWYKEWQRKQKQKQKEKAKAAKAAGQAPAGGEKTGYESDSVPVTGAGTVRRKGKKGKWPRQGVDPVSPPRVQA